MKIRLYITLCLVALGSVMLQSCADSKELEIKGQMQTVEPYGWADYDTVKNPYVNYEVSWGNVAWSVVLFETVGIPIWLTGYQMYEPVSVKVEGRGLPVNPQDSLTAPLDTLKQ